MKINNLVFAIFKFLLCFLMLFSFSFFLNPVFSGECELEIKNCQLSIKKNHPTDCTINLNHSSILEKLVDWRSTNDIVDNIVKINKMDIDESDYNLNLIKCNDSKTQKPLQVIDKCLSSFTQSLKELLKSGAKLSDKIYLCENDILIFAKKLDEKSGASKQLYIAKSLLTGKNMALKTPVSNQNITEIFSFESFVSKKIIENKIDNVVKITPCDSLEQDHVKNIGIMEEMYENDLKAYITKFSEQKPKKSINAIKLYNQRISKLNNYLTAMTCTLLPTIRKMHQQNIFHLDIKPQNILVARTKDKNAFALTDLDTAWVNSDDVEKNIPSRNLENRNNSDPGSKTEAYRSPMSNKLKGTGGKQKNSEDTLSTDVMVNISAIDDYWSFALSISELALDTFVNPRDQDNTSPISKWQSKLSKLTSTTNEKNNEKENEKAMEDLNNILTNNFNENPALKNLLTEILNAGAPITNQQKQSKIDNSKLKEKIHKIEKAIETFFKSETCNDDKLNNPLTIE
ncbi:MAG: hypothetical protein HQK49_05695 [Oligoflexia bacterium]|nr:hypothetical protein [Oligoflexia bacterium]